MEELQPYLTVATRTYQFEGVVMRFIGETQIPEFEGSPHTPPASPYFLGHACQGEQVPQCLQFYQGFFADFDEQTMGETICIPKCRKR